MWEDKQLIIIEIYCSAIENQSIRNTYLYVEIIIFSPISPTFFCNFFPDHCPIALLY